MKVSELEALQRIEKPSKDESNRIAELTHKNTPVRPKTVRTRPDAPEIWEQMDKIHEKFIGEIEPWTEMKCTKCKKVYILIDGAKCLCGKKESDGRQLKHIGSRQIGSKKVS